MLADLNRVRNGTGSASFRFGTTHRATYPPCFRINADGAVFIPVNSGGTAIVIGVGGGSGIWSLD